MREKRGKVGDLWGKRGRWGRVEGGKLKPRAATKGKAKRENYEEKREREGRGQSLEKTAKITARIEANGKKCEKLGGNSQMEFIKNTLSTPWGVTKETKKNQTGSFEYPKDQKEFAEKIDRGNKGGAQWEPRTALYKKDYPKSKVALNAGQRGGHVSDS